MGGGAVREEVFGFVVALDRERHEGLGQQRRQREGVLRPRHGNPGPRGGAPWSTGGPGRRTGSFGIRQGRFGGAGQQQARGPQPVVALRDLPSLAGEQPVRLMRCERGARRSPRTGNRRAEAVGLWLLARPSPAAWQVSALVCLSAFAGYVLTRSVPVPGDRGDVGNWLEPLGVVALMTEAIVTILAVLVLASIYGSRVNRRG